MKCVDCLGEATITVLSPDGYPVGTFCQPCYDAAVRFGEQVMKLLRDGINGLDGAAGLTGDQQVADISS